MNESNEELALDDVLKKMQRADQLSRQVISYARNTLFVHLRFMENALSRLVFVPYGGTIATDMCRLYYNSQFILPDFQKNDKTLTHRYLHIILHFPARLCWPCDSPTGLESGVRHCRGADDSGIASEVY